MMTDELDAMATSDPKLSRVFDGVYPADMLPVVPQDHDYAYIINADPSHKPGSHWLAVYFTPECCEWWDSFGWPPHVYGPAIARFCALRPRLVQKSRRIQALDSDVCGHHCLFFLWHRVRGTSLQEIAAKFTSNMQWNDQNVRTFVRDHFRRRRLRRRLMLCKQCALKQRDVMTLH